MVRGASQPAAENTKSFSSPNAEFALIGGDALFAMTFNGDADPDALPDLARDQCGSRSWCKVLGWADPNFAARGMPMTDREVGQLAFSYLINRPTNYEQVLWNCSRWKKRPASECLSGTPAPAK
jgi:hypothetical protein